MTGASRPLGAVLELEWNLHLRLLVAASPLVTEGVVLEALDVNLL